MSESAWGERPDVAPMIQRPPLAWQSSDGNLLYPFDGGYLQVANDRERRVKFFYELPAGCVPLVPQRRGAA